MFKTPARMIVVWRDEGPRGLWWRGLGRTVYRRLLVVARTLGVPEMGETQSGPVEFSFLGPDEVDQYASLRPDMPKAETRRRLEAGQTCLIGRHDGEIVHARWFDSEVAESPWLGLAFELRPGVVYAHDAFTATKARGLRIGASAPRYERILWERGARAILATISPANVAGMRLSRGYGYEPVGTLAAFRLAAIRIPVRRLPDGYLGAAHRLSVPVGSAQSADSHAEG